MNSCPGNCRRVLEILRRDGRWLTFEQLGKLGMKQSERRRINTLVKLGLVERRSMSSPTTGHFAEHRIRLDSDGLLFYAPADPTLTHSTRGAK